MEWGARVVGAVLLPMIALCHTGSPLEILEYGYVACFVNPLFKLYMHGPSLWGVGFWEGRSSSEICTLVTGNGNQVFWLENVDECRTLIQRKFNSFEMMIKLILYFYAMLRMFHGVVGLVTVNGPKVLWCLMCQSGRTNARPLTLRAHCPGGMLPEPPRKPGSHDNRNE